MLLGVYGEDLATASLCQLFLDFFDQSAFLGIDAFLGKVTRFGDNKSHFALELRIELGAVQSSYPVGMIGVHQEGVEHGA
jgi:hypothetical protein